MPSAKRHTLFAAYDPRVGEVGYPQFYVDCPHDLSETNRDCLIRDTPNVCGLEHWLEHGGHDLIGVRAAALTNYPIHGYVEWAEAEYPILVVPS